MGNRQMNNQIKRRWRTLLVLGSSVILVFLIICVLAGTVIVLVKYWPTDIDENTKTTVSQLATFLGSIMAAAGSLVAAALLFIALMCQWLELTEQRIVTTAMARDMATTQHLSVLARIEGAMQAMGEMKSHVLTRCADTVGTGTVTKYQRDMLQEQLGILINASEELIHAWKTEVKNFTGEEPKETEDNMLRALLLLDVKPLI